LPISATLLARLVDGADAPASNVFSDKNLDRIHGGLLFAATSNVPWALLRAKTFDVDQKACHRCEGRISVPALVRDELIENGRLRPAEELSVATQHLDDDASQGRLEASLPS
jgi:hypothetical protein